VLGAQALERRDDCLLIHLHRIGDHTRGLFEAETSIAVSAAHALQNIEIVCLGCHWGKESLAINPLHLKTRPSAW
jgi:hypothetical protein